MEELFRNETGIVTREGSFIRIRRTHTPTPALLAAKDFGDRFRWLVPMRERRHLGLLFDVRDAPMNTDESATGPLNQLVAELMQGFPRVAVLVRTAIGKLQTSRMAREQNSPVRVFDNEEAAVAYARGEDPPGPRSAHT
jgi:hypothetical protein